MRNKPVVMLLVIGMLFTVSLAPLTAAQEAEDARSESMTRILMLPPDAEVTGMNINAQGHFFVNAMHPGWSDTPGVQKSLPLFRRLTRLVLRSHAEGADTVVWMAQANQAALSTGKLFLDREPRSTYLLGNNVESDDARKALEPRLQHDFESTRAAPPS